MELIESPPKFESETDRSFKEAVHKGIDKALQTISTRFEHNTETVDNNLAFHNTEHTIAMMNRAEKILKIIQEMNPDKVSDHDIFLAKLIASYHDIVQNWKDNPIKNETSLLTNIKRQRDVENNELQSYKELEQYMKDTNTNSGKEIFKEGDFTTAQEAILATIPGFNVEHNTVVQPKREKEPSLVAEAIRLADLGAAALENPDVFVKEGADLFVEENVDIIRLLRDYSIDELTDEVKNDIRGRIIAWSKFQPLFVTGRKHFIEDDLKFIPASAQKILTDMFEKGIEKAKIKAVETAHQREQMSFVDLLKSIGYTNIKAFQPIRVQELSKAA